jgi:integrase
MFRVHLADWENRRLSEISDDEVTELHESIGTKRGHYVANRVCQLLRAAFNFAMDPKRKYVASNPAAHFTPFEERPRQRGMTLRELSYFRTALAQDPSEFWRDFFTVAMFTAGRRSNLCSMRWQEIDFPNGQWIIPAEKSKTERELILNLSRPALAILQRRLQDSDSEWVWPSYGSTGHMTQIKYPWKNLLARAAKIELEQWKQDHPGKTKAHFDKQKRGTLADLHFHDLRRVIGGLAAQAGASLLEIGAMLGHVPGSAVTARTYMPLVSKFSSQAVAKTAALIESGAAPLQLTDGSSEGGRDADI